MDCASDEVGLDAMNVKLIPASEVEVGNPSLRAFIHGFKLGAVESGFTARSVEKCNADADFKAGYDAATVAKLDAVHAFLVGIPQE